MSDSGSTFTLEGKHALVTGVGGPLARPAAVALAEGGATVSLFTQADDRAQEVEAQSILNECWSLGRDGQVCRLDSTDELAVQSALDRLEAQVGPISVLVTVHPAAWHQPAAAADRSAWDAEIACSATAVVVPVLAAGRRMLDRGGGRIVNVVSDLYEGRELETAFFAASQAAVLAFTRALAVEWLSQQVVAQVLIVDEIEAGGGPHSHAELRGQLRALFAGDPEGLDISSFVDQARPSA